jgi:hypothetical protein
MAWTAVLPSIGGGLVGASLTYGLTWLRERRRTLDAYRAPQRAAVSDIMTATNGLMVQELASRTQLTRYLERIGQPGQSRGPSPFDDPTTSPVAVLGNATIDVERAFRIGSLNIVDAPCWQAMGVAYTELSRLRTMMAGPHHIKTVGDVEQYVKTVNELALNMSKAVTELVLIASQRVTPAENLWNRRQRDAIRQQFAASGQLAPPVFAKPPTEQPPR